MNRYGGRISDPHDMKFAGYLDSEEAIQAAECHVTGRTRPLRS